MSHMLNVNIYTYSDFTWKKYSGNFVDSLFSPIEGGIYLHHVNGNHYNVVESVLGTNISPSVNQCKCDTIIRTNYKTTKRTCSLETPEDNEHSSLEHGVKRRKLWFQKQYQNNEQFRNTILKKRKAHYEKHKAKKKEYSKKKYSSNAKHRNRKKEFNKKKYRTDIDYQEHLKERTKMKYKTNLAHQRNLKECSKRKYKTDVVFQRKLIEYGTTKYKTNETFREKVKKNLRLKYQDKSYQLKKKEDVMKRYHKKPEQKAKVKQRRKDIEKSKYVDTDYVLDNFIKKTAQGPRFACSSCHRLLFQNQVQKCDIETLKVKSESVWKVARQCISDKYVHKCLPNCPQDCLLSSHWICKTCHRKIMESQIPAECAANNMELYDVPVELENLNTLEKHLIALHIPFMKVAALPRGGQNSINGPVVCVPSDTKKVEALPRTADEDMVIKVKLKRKLSYRGHYEYQFVNPAHVQEALVYLKEHNNWYSEIDIKKDSSIKGFSMEESPLDTENEETTEQKDSDHDQQQNGIQYDTCLQPVDIGQEVLDHYFDDIYNIAPAEGKNPVRMLQEDGNEAKSFPHLFPNGKKHMDRGQGKEDYTRKVL